MIIQNTIEPIEKLMIVEKNSFFLFLYSKYNLDHEESKENVIYVCKYKINVKYSDKTP